MAHRPSEVSTVAKLIFGHTNPDALKRDFNNAGWHFVREVSGSGAWWIRKGDLEVMIVFGGPRRQATAFSWREVGGATERI